MMPKTEMIILQRTERSMVRNMCVVQQKNRNRTKRVILVLNETIDHFAIVNCLLIWSCVDERG